MRTKFILCWLVLLLSMSCTTSCSGYVRQLQQQYIWGNLTKLRNYEGSLTQTGLISGGGDLVSSVKYQSPGTYLIQTTSPKQLAGNIFYSNENEILLIFKNTQFAIEFENAPPMTWEGKKKLIQDQFDWDMDHYHFSMVGSGQVAGHKTNHLDFVSRNNGAFFKTGSLDVYDAFSFPLGGRYEFDHGRSYSFHYSEILFNQSASTSFTKPVIPENYTVSKWDFNSRSFTADEAKAASNFKGKLPSDLPQKSLPRGLSLKKIIRQEGVIPAFTFSFANGPYFLNATVFKDYGISGIPTDPGIQMKTGKKGTLLIGPHSSSYSFISQGTQYILVGDLPPEELLEFSEKL